MIIYGAGLAGLITAHMLRRHQPVIHEAQSSLPNNHEALLRFRSDAVARATGIPFKEVEVTKTINIDGRTFSHPDIRVNNLYSFKVTGEYHARSISDTHPAKRYIAPPDFISQLARSLNIQYNSSLKSLNSDADSAVISTVPMPIMMNIADWPSKPEFRYKSIWSVWMTISYPTMALYQTIYYPGTREPYYRASITGNKLIIEYIRAPKTLKEDLHSIFHDFGICMSNLRFNDPDVKEQKYGKLLPIADSERRAFMLELTDKYRIYSVGRFATWRQILMDDVVKDVERVATWINDRDTYQRRLDGHQ